MTPLEIHILVHYYCGATDFRDGDFEAPAVRDAINNFKDSGFLEASSENDLCSIYQATSKCKVYIEALCAVPEPVQRWVIPAAPSGQDQGGGES